MGYCSGCRETATIVGGLSGMLEAITVGFKAHAALGRAAGAARVHASLSDSLYLDVGHEIVWVGREGASLHPRGVFVRAVPLGCAVGSGITVDVSAARSWTPPRDAPLPDAPRVVAAGGRRLLATLDALGAPRGFGALLAGPVPEFPVDRLVPRARALADACRRDDALGAADAAQGLLGAGPGLTPAGDDLVGGAFFARGALAPPGESASRWRAAAAAVRERARGATHPIGFALLTDLLEGHGWAPLHDLLVALSAASPQEALAAARRLVALGHSSGWDLLAGFLAGALGGLGAEDA
jgi:hypothetical protein